MTKIIILSVFLSFSSVAICQTGWFQQNSGTGYYLRSVFFVDSNTGYAVGDTGGTLSYHIILKTTNGGTNWIKQSVPHPSDTVSLASVF